MTEEKLDEVIKRYTDNAEYVRQRGDLEGCMEFRELAEFLTECKKLFITCEDAVSRSSFDLRLRAAVGMVEEELTDDFKDGIRMTLELLKTEPSVTPKQKWIPVDYDSYPETYPKPFQEVWITDRYGEVEHKAYGGTRNIKAWMPYIIPEPYKEGVSE